MTSASDDLIADEEYLDELCGDACPVCGKFCSPDGGMNCSHYQGSVIGTTLWQQRRVLDDFQSSLDALYKTRHPDSMIVKMFEELCGAVTGDGWETSQGTGCNIYLRSEWRARRVVAFLHAWIARLDRCSGESVPNMPLMRRNIAV